MDFSRRAALLMTGAASIMTALAKLPAMAQASLTARPRRAVTNADKHHPLTLAASNKTVVGYGDQITVRPGETITFFASTYAPGDYRASLVRVINGDTLSGVGRFRVDLEAELRLEACRAQHAHGILAKAGLRIADQPQAPGGDVFHAADVVPDGEVGDVVVERIGREIAAPDVFVDGAVDVVPQDASGLIEFALGILIRGVAACGRLPHFIKERRSRALGVRWRWRHVNR